MGIKGRGGGRDLVSARGHAAQPKSVQGKLIQWDPQGNQEIPAELAPDRATQFLSHSIQAGQKIVADKTSRIWTENLLDLLNNRVTEVEGQVGAGEEFSLIELTPLSRVE